MRFKTLDDWLRWQEGLHYKAIDLGLERCQAVAERMDLLSPGFHVISIAGTNGKGTSAAMLDMIYRQAGYNVGVYTSPHLVRYNERIRINGSEVTDQQLCEAFHRVDQARGEISLTYFEFGTLAALDLFRNHPVQLGILEVGMGGRLDAVNILDADVALICTIDLDHQQWLGDTRELIGREKAGIMRAGRPAVCVDSDVPASVIAVAAEIGARFYRIGHDFRMKRNSRDWDWHSDTTTVLGLQLSGPFNDAMGNNAAGVLMAVKLLNDLFPVADDVIRTSLNLVSVPGRYQIITAEVPIILDVAHNPQAAAMLAHNLARQETSGATHMIIGMLSDKNHRSVLESLSMAVDYWYVVSLTSDRGTDGQVLVKMLEEMGAKQVAGKFTDVNSALASARKHARMGDRIVVTGSFLTVGAALQQLGSKQ